MVKHLEATSKQNHKVKANNMDLIQVTISSVLCVVLIYLMVYEHKQMEQKNKFPYFDNLAERVNTMNNTWKVCNVITLK